MFDTLRRQKLLSFTLLLFTLSLGILIGTLLKTGVSAQGQGAPDAAPLTVPSAVQLSTEFTQLAKKLEPSVVNITTDYNLRQQTSRNRRQQAPQDQEDQFDFFQRFFGPQFEMPAPRRSSGTGSGVVVDPNGYILTNNHVVEQADRIKVKLTGDSTEYTAKLIGTDPETDLAVIKIDAPRKLTAAKIGNSDGVQVGDWAVAIGSPFGLETTVTAGIISAKERNVGQQFQHFLQTDAAINPGNSGGPLLNIRGEVIGINTAIATSSRGYQGVGFALPMNTAVKVYNQIIKSGRVTRGSIGVRLQGSEDLLKAYGGTTKGAFVQSVEPGSPADKAGLKEADIIVSMNGRSLSNNDDLVNAVSEAPIGSSATLGVIRDGKRIDLRVTVADRADVYANDPRIAGNRPGDSEQSDSAGKRFGFSAQGLSSAQRAELGLEAKQGVRIDSVEPGSFADDIGIQAGDILTEVNRQPVGSADDIRRIQSSLKPGDAVGFRVLRPSGQAVRGGRQQWTPVYLGGTLPGQF
ncbi:MAG: Do family serine endopeptidase [Bryobacterales bacterium]|nr:Do family serine endopeptidase [Bryobacterales bacterium]